MRATRRLGPLAVAVLVAASSCTRLGYDLLDDAGSGSSVGGTPNGSGADGGTAGSAASASGAGANDGGANDGGTNDGGTSGGGTSGGGTSGGGSGGTQGNPAGAGGGATQNTPPVAAMIVSPPVGDTATAFATDGGNSSDGEQPASELTFAWDWESDGTYDDSGITAMHTYGSEGSYTITLRVTDQEGATATTTTEVAVVAGGNLLVVTTGDDEQDPAATPGNPQSTGFSLREAIIVSNDTAGTQTIYVPPETVPLLTVDMGQLEPITSAVDLFGYGTAVDGSALGGATDCFVITGSDVRLLGFEITGCPDRPVSIEGGSNNQVADCFIHDNGGAVYSANGSGHTLGPNNVVAHSGSQGVFVNAPTTIISTLIRDSAGACMQIGGGAPGTVARGNLCLRTANGINISTNADNVTLYNNTIASSGAAGITVGGVTGLRIVNNSITGSLGWGVISGEGPLVAKNNNLLFVNATGDCSNCSFVDSLFEEPRYVDPGADDYRPSSDSPLVDAGADVAWPFNGSAPDIGFYEL